MPRKFDLYSRWWFLTYPLCDYDIFDAAERLKRLPYFASKEYTITICSEEHTKGDNCGELHIHVLICFTSRQRTRNSRVADLGSYHCHVEPARSPASIHEYLHKYSGGVCCSNGQVFCNIDKKDLPEEIENEWQVIRHGARSRTDFIERVKDLDYRFYLAHASNIIGEAERNFPVVSVSSGDEYENSEFNNVPDCLQDWIRENVVSDGGSAPADACARFPRWPRPAAQLMYFSLGQTVSTGIQAQGSHSLQSTVPVGKIQMGTKPFPNIQLLEDRFRCEEDTTPRLALDTRRHGDLTDMDQSAHGRTGLLHREWEVLSPDYSFWSCGDMVNQSLSRFWTE